jgi:hypothetical protein
MEKQYNPFMKGLNQGPKIEDLDQLQCVSCGNSIFDQFYRMYRMSALTSPNGKAQVFHVPVFACASCGEILDIKKIENLPEEKVDNSSENKDIK